MHLAQNVGAYANVTHDASAGQAYAYAQTWLEYSSAYYYDAYADVYLYITPASGTQYAACANYSRAVNGPTEVSCSASISGEAELVLDTVHELNITYYVYQFDYYCTWDCYYWWDGFRTSLLGVNGGTYYEDTSWFAPGPPAERIPQQTSLIAYGQRRRTIGCPTPQGETSYFYQWSSTFYFVAGYFARLNGPFSYDGRTIGETVSTPAGGGDGCHFTGSLHNPMTITGGGGWSVGRLWGENLTYLGPAPNQYGIDYVGATNSTAIQYYQNLMRTGAYPKGSSCSLWFLQTMYIDGCGRPSRYYGTANSLSVTVTKDSVTSQRGTAAAAR